MFGPGRARLAAAYARVYVLHIVIFMRVMLRPAASFRATVFAVIQLPHSECVRVYWRAIWLRVRSGKRVIYIFVVVLILSVHRNYLFFVLGEEPTVCSALSAGSRLRHDSPDDRIAYAPDQQQRLTTSSLQTLHTVAAVALIR